MASALLLALALACYFGFALLALSQDRHWERAGGGRLAQLRGSDVRQAERHPKVGREHEGECGRRTLLGAAVRIVDEITRTLAEAEPEGLYADLLKGEVPDYLEPVAGPHDSVLQLYRVKPE